MFLVNLNGVEIAVFGGAAGGYNSVLDAAAAASGIVYGAVVTGYSGRGADTVGFDAAGNVYVARSFCKKINFIQRELMGRQFSDSFSLDADGNIVTKTDTCGYIRVGGKTPKAYQLLAVCAAVAADASNAAKINSMQRVDVHHKNKVHRDNSVDNLEVMDHKDHKLLHSKTKIFSI